MSNKTKTEKITEQLEYTIAPEGTVWEDVLKNQKWLLTYFQRLRIAVYEEYQIHNIVSNCDCLLCQTFRDFHDVNIKG